MNAPFVPIDHADYAHAPAMNVASGISLAQALVKACPANPEPNVAKARNYLAGVAEQALVDFTDRNKELGVYSAEDSRILDNQADRSWGALRLRLQGMSMIPEQTDKAAQAKEMDWKLFQGSTEFLKEEYVSQSTRMAALLKQIGDDQLQAKLDELCGPEFLAACREVQPKYEAMVSERLRRDKASGTNLNETLRALGTAIVNYASKVLSTVEPNDPASHENARKLLRPIEAHREAWAKGPPVVTEEEPVPTPGTTPPVTP